MSPAGTSVPLTISPTSKNGSNSASFTTTLTYRRSAADDGIASSIASTAGSYRFIVPTCTTFPARSRAAMIASQSASVMHIGFSTKTWMPASSAAITTSACVPAGDVTTTPSRPPASSIAR